MTWIKKRKGKEKDWRRKINERKKKETVLKVKKIGNEDGKNIQNTSGTPI